MAVVGGALHDQAVLHRAGFLEAVGVPETGHGGERVGHAELGLAGAQAAHSGGRAANLLHRGVDAGLFVDHFTDADTLGVEVAADTGGADADRLLGVRWQCRGKPGGGRYGGQKFCLRIHSKSPILV